MNLYRCIGCGAEGEKSPSCTCSVCGCQTYEMPYERATILRSEIRTFLADGLLSPLKEAEVLFLREETLRKNAGEEKVTFLKEEDDARFPTVDTIFAYLASAGKTETFANRCHETVAGFRRHLFTPYEREYRASYRNIEKQMEVRDKTLALAAQKLEMELPAGEAVFPALRLSYREVPREDLFPTLTPILDGMDALVSKMVTFIRQNNLYGRIYAGQGIPKAAWKEKEEAAPALERLLRTLEKVLAKRYVVDIFEDGSAEFLEMYRTFLTVIHTLSVMPMFEKRFDYALEDGTPLPDGPDGAVAAALEEKCRPLRETLYAAFPTEVTEEELFEAYNEMIELDNVGYFRGRRSAFFRKGRWEAELDRLIGLAPVKDSIRKLKAYVVANRENPEINLHMMFLGNPGTGKTEVARIIAGILYENKILPTSRVVEVSRADLVGQYVGETPQKTMNAIRQAMGGVLFIDEAYSLVAKGASFDYGHEAVATLIKAMEDHRGKFCVILAGYKNEMESMIATNPGFRSRIQFALHFPNYSRSELEKITQLMIEARGYRLVDGALDKILDITDVKRKDQNFANAREIRNILDLVIMNQNLRVMNGEDRELGIADVNQYIADAHLSLPTHGEGKKERLMTAEEELDALIGLDSVKRAVKKIRAYAKRNRGQEDFNVHMCFLGNPGTGKTEVARILSRILYEAGVIPESKLVETDAHGLIGKYLGETAPKTEELIDRAMGGVLFIDEAYALSDRTAGTSGYGAEAISVLLKRMEDDRGRFAAVLAGYGKEMRDMISTNPGLESRIQFTLEFPDYSREELGKILELFAAKKGYTLQADAVERFLCVVEYYRSLPNFANARTVRNVLDQVIMNQNLRTEEEVNFVITAEDVEDYISDEGIRLTASPQNRIGFF